MNDENGFSLLEVAATAAIMLTLSAIVSTILITTGSTITKKAQEVKTINNQKITTITGE